MPPIPTSIGDVFFEFRPNRSCHRRGWSAHDPVNWTKHFVGARRSRARSRTLNIVASVPPTHACDGARGIQTSEWLSRTTHLIAYYYCRLIGHHNNSLYSSSSKETFAKLETARYTDRARTASGSIPTLTVV